MSRVFSGRRVALAFTAVAALSGCVDSSQVREVPQRAVYGGAPRGAAAASARDVNGNIGLTDFRISATGQIVPLQPDAISAQQEMRRLKALAEQAQREAAARKAAQKAARARQTRRSYAAQYDDEDQMINDAFEQQRLEREQFMRQQQEQERMQNQSYGIYAY